MSTHVLLNLSNELGERDQMRDLQSILLLFCNKFDKFNNTSARMFDSYYHMRLANNKDGKFNILLKEVLLSLFLSLIYIIY